MRGRLPYIILALAGFYLLLAHFTPLRSYRNIPAIELGARDVELSAEIDQLQKKQGSNPTEADKRELYRMVTERGKILAELTLRRFFVDQLVVVLLIMMLFLLVVGRLKRRQGALPVNKDELIRDMNVAIDTPREEYIDEWELPRRIEMGFRSKEEAIRWLKDDPSLICDYCRSPLRSTFTGQRESLQLITFYKAVPDGAKDLRVVLGSYWFPKHASELRCSRCGKVTQR